jgi:hypothetical protein
VFARCPEEGSRNQRNEVLESCQVVLAPTMEGYGTL